jgi:hypothetical protein
MRKLFYKITVTFLIKNNQIKPISHNFNTRGKLNSISIPYVNKSTTQSSFLYIEPYIYNNLPYELRDYTNYVVFKLNLSNWLLQQAADISFVI